MQSVVQNARRDKAKDADRRACTPAQTSTMLCSPWLIRTFCKTFPLTADGSRLAAHVLP
jgi:hypothetical protein